jgi:hypothetical protein
MQNCQQPVREKLMRRFKETQEHKVKSNEYEFKENLVLLRVKTRQKLEPLWKSPCEMKEIKRLNAIIQGVDKRKYQ